MSKNAQILLENLIEQEFRNNDNYSNISEYFEFSLSKYLIKNNLFSFCVIFLYLQTTALFGHTSIQLPQCKQFFW